MQHIVYKGEVGQINGCYLLGQLFKYLLTISSMFAERDTEKRPFRSTPNSFETAEIYYNPQGGYEND